MRDQSGYLAQDTIAAIASAVGGAISVVRLSGPGAFAALERLAPGVRQAEPRKLVRARLKDPHGSELDDALVARFVSPESFTGEDVVELNLHGGAFIASRVMETLHELGVRQALPGEFSFRAVRNGKLTVSQAQAVAELIAASNDGAVGLALEKLSGTQNQLIQGLAVGLRNLAVLGEAGIDFADQDIDEVSLPALRERLKPLLATLEHLRSSYERGTRLQEGVSVAFVGLPNTGKSSFFNALLGEDRSIVSDIAGTTRDVVREKITLRGERSSVTLRLEDTAGLRLSHDPIEKIGIERSRKAAQHADLVLFLVDPQSPPAQVREQWALLGSPAARSLGIFTKSDQHNAVQLDRLRHSYQDLGLVDWVSTSAQTGAGITDTVNAITRFCEKWLKRDRGEVLLTRLDHLRAVEGAIEHLERAGQAPDIELFAADIRQALHSLSLLIGETLPDDILGKIFSEFCIGK